MTCLVQCLFKKQLLSLYWEHQSPTLCSSVSCSLCSSDETPTWGCSLLTASHRPNNKQAQQQEMHGRKSHQQTQLFMPRPLRKQFIRDVFLKEAPFAKSFRSDIFPIPSSCFWSAPQVCHQIPLSHLKFPTSLSHLYLQEPGSANPRSVWPAAWRCCNLPHVFDPHFQLL